MKNTKPDTSMLVDHFVGQDTTIPADVSRDARAYLRRVGADDLAPMLGLGGVA